MFLAGDIGGTKVDLCLFGRGEKPDTPVIHTEGVLPSQDASSLEALVSEFLPGGEAQVLKAVFAVAGPVLDGRSAITNLPWLVSEAGLSRKLRIPSVRLINDLEAVARYVPHLKPNDVRTLSSGIPSRGGNVGVIAPGTGLGESFLSAVPGGFSSHATEGGHVDFAPTRPIEMRLLEFLLKRYNHVSYERVCSGMALSHIYDFLKEEGVPEPGWLARRVKSEADTGAAIVKVGTDCEDPPELCRRTLELFVSILGAEAGNFALKIMATGGIYLGGGIPPRILPYLSGEDLITAFTGKGRMASLLKSIPVHVILDPKAALHGAMHMALVQ